jgi:hypothetical protein
MPGRSSKNSSGVARAAQAGKRAWPYVLLAWERWQTLSDEEKEKYRKRAKELAARGRDLAMDVKTQVEQQTGGAKKRRRS